MLWDEHKAGNLSRDQVVDGIVDLYATRETPSNDPSVTYWYYYAQGHADAWDANNPNPNPPPIPGPP